MSKMGRPKGSNNKEYVYSLRMDERTRRRLEMYCLMMNKSKSDAIRDAIDLITQKKENEENENN